MGTGKTKRVFTRDFKLTLARQLVSGDRRMSQICREHSLCESVVRRWKLHYERNGEASWTETAIPLSARSPARSTGDVAETVVVDRVKELEAALGQAHLEIEFLKLALEKKPSREQLPGLPLYRMCQLLGLSRSLVYRPLSDKEPEQAQETALVSAIDQIVLRFPGYGYRRVTAQLARDGHAVNHKRVLRLMREQGLLCRRKRQWVKTTDSEHGLRTYPNLLQGKKASDLSALNQVWVSDITYVRLGEGSGFCYVAAVLDAFSRRVVGWHISRDIDAALVLVALEKALATRQPEPGQWIHHSDQGVQYACRGYVERLTATGAQISMSRKGRPRDNAQAESFFRTLKVEEVYLQEYSNFTHASACLAQFTRA